VTGNRFGNNSENANVEKNMDGFQCFT